MKLHLPKLLLTAVLAVVAVGSGASALSLEHAIVSYSSFSTAAGASITLPQGWTYDASTGTLTGIDYSSICFKLDTSALTADKADTEVIYVNSLKADQTNQASWGFITDSTGTNLKGYWNNYSDADGAYGSAVVNNATLTAGKDENNKVVLHAKINGSGTYLYSDKGVSLYGDSGLKTTSGTLSSVTIDKSLVTDILYDVTYSDATIVSNTNGSWSKEYATISYNSFPSSKVDATVISSSTLQISGNSDTSSYGNPASGLVENGGDIIIGNKGQLFLQTWQTNNITTGLNIDLSDADIYIGAGANDYGALRLAAWSGDIVLGDITLIEDSAIWKEAAANGHTLSFNGAVSGDYTLEIKLLDATTFAGTVDLSGIKTTGSTTATFGSASVVTIDTLTTRAATSFTAEEGASVTFTDVNLDNNSRLTVTGEMTVSGQIESKSGGSGLTVNEDSTLTIGKLKNSWGIAMQIDGLLEIGSGGLQMTSGHADTVTGSGTITTSVLGVGNTGTYTFEGGLRLEIGAGGIKQTTENTTAVEKTILKDVTIAATESWTADVTKNLNLASATGTTFEIAESKSATISGVLSDYVINDSTTHVGKLVKDGKGTLTLKGNNTYTGGTDVKAGKLAAATGKALGKGGTTTISGGSLEITDAKATITKKSGNANATVSYISGSADDVYGIGNSGYKIEDAKVELASDGATTISNLLDGVELVNNGAGTVTAGNADNVLSAINADAGNVDIVNTQAQTLSSLTIGAGKTVGLYTGAAAPTTPTSADEATVTTGNLTAGAGAKLNANLVLSDGATVKLADALTMGSSVTLGEGMTLSGDLVSTIQGLGEGETTNLFTGVDELYLGGSTTASGNLTEADAVTLGTYFTGFDDTYYLGYDGQNVFAGVKSPVTPAVPEPTTATLSLLALAALASRRRRK